MANESKEVAEYRDLETMTARAEEIQAHLRRILDSPHFAQAHQLQHFLDHLVRETLAGREGELKEYSLGRDVFRRGESYDPRTDAIVRVQASLLRKRLAAYYANGGSGETLRIEMPKGSYIPHFVVAPGIEASQPVPEANDQAVVETNPASRRGLLRMGLGFLAGAGAVGVPWMWNHREERRAERSGAEGGLTFPARELSTRIWGPLLSGDKPIQLAFGCPQFFRGGGLYVRDVNVNNTNAEASDRRLRDLTERLGLYLTPSPNTYTGVGEILGIYRMTQFVTHQGMESTLENVQLLTPELVRNKNLILVSSYRFRTLLDLLSLPKAFDADFDGSGAYFALDPKEGEPLRYGPISSGGVSRSYGLVSYWPRPDTGGRILLMSGIESWATQGAVMYITGEQFVRNLERRIETEFTEKSKGLQVLVEIQGRDDRAINVRYVTHRVL